MFYDLEWQLLTNLEDVCQPLEGGGREETWEKTQGLTTLRFEDLCLSLVTPIKWVTLKERSYPPRSIELKTLRSISEHFSHEKSKSPLVEVSKESGEGTSQILIKVGVTTKNLIVERAPENEMHLHLWLL